MSRQDALQLEESLDAGDVSRVWLVWSGAAETAIVDAYQFSGGLLHGRGHVLGSGSAWLMDVLDAMTRYGVSLSRSVELTNQWDRILADGPLYPVTLDDLSVVRGMGIGAFHHAVSDVHRRLSDFIHAVVVHRRDEAVRVWRNWIREDTMVHPYRWFRPGLVPPSSTSPVKAPSYAW